MAVSEKDLFDLKLELKELEHRVEKCEEAQEWLDELSQVPDGEGGVLDITERVLTIVRSIREQAPAIREGLKQLQADKAAQGELDNDDEVELEETEPAEA